MEKEFVPYPLALRLKALGFDEPCFGFYKLGNIDIYYDTILQGQNHKFRNNTQLNFYGDLKEKVSAPTFSQAFRWLMQFPQIKKYRYNIALYSDGTYSIKDGKDSIHENLSAEDCLDKLLEIVEQKQK